MDSEPKRESLNVPVSPQTRVLIDKIRDDTGVPKVEAVSRIFEWFASLDRKLRLAVLTRDVETRQELTKLVIREMAGLPKQELAESAEALDGEQTIAAMRAMLDRMDIVHRSVVESFKAELAEKRKKEGK